MSARTASQQKKIKRLRKLNLPKTARLLASDNTVYVFDTLPKQNKRLRNAGLTGTSTRGFRWHVPKKEEV